MDDKKSEEKSSKKKTIMITMLILILCIAILPLRVVRNGVCKYSGYTICVATDFGSVDYEMKDLNKIREEKIDAEGE